MSRKPRHVIGALVTASALVTLASACGGSASPDDLESAGGDQNEVRAIANPVDILRKLESSGCVVAEGTEVGDTDIHGNRYAECNYFDNSGSGGTRVVARTYPGDPVVAEGGKLPVSDDSHKKILGEDFIVTITGDWSSYSKHVDPSEIALLVGGEFIGPS